MFYSTGHIPSVPIIKALHLNAVNKTSARIEAEQSYIGTDYVNQPQFVHE